MSHDNHTSFITLKTVQNLTLVGHLGTLKEEPKKEPCKLKYVFWVGKVYFVEFWLRNVPQITPCSFSAFHIFLVIYLP